MEVSEAASAGSTAISSSASTSSSASKPAAAINRRRSPPCADYRSGLHFFLLLLSFASVIYFILLPERPLISQGIYNDENALMVAQHESQMRADHSLQQQILHWEEGARKATSIKQWIVQELALLPVEVSEYTHDHSSSPHSDISSNVTTSVLSAIWRAPKSDGKECVAFVTMYDEADLATTSTGGAPLNIEASISSLPVMLAFLRYLSLGAGVKYYSRDVIFVIVEKQSRVPSITSKLTGSPQSDARKRSSEALEGWLEAYYDSEAALNRAGTILSALVVDVPFASDKFECYKSVSLDVVGYRGLLPNLDFPSILLRLFERSSFTIVVSESAVMSEEKARPPHTPSAKWIKLVHKYAPFLSASFYSSQTNNEVPWNIHLEHILMPLLGATHPSQLPISTYSLNLGKWKGLWRFMLSALQGGNEGNLHAPFNARAIDAGTIRAIPAQKSTCRESNRLSLAVAMAQNLEHTFRSINNQIEKLHHSTFWYLLNHAKDFTTMSKYIYVAVLALVCFPIYAFALLYAQPGAFQKWGHSLLMVFSVYALVISQFGFVDVARIAVGQGKWDQDAISAWLTFVVASTAGYFLFIFPRLSLLRSSSTAAVAAAASRIQMIQPYVDPKELTSHLSPEEIQKRDNTLARGSEIPFSPSFLPLISFAELQAHQRQDLPRFESTFDVRLTTSLLLLACSIVLVPVMVINFSVCVLALAFISPLFLASCSIISPTKWVPFLKQALGDEHMKTLRVSYAAEAIKFLWRRTLHLLVLVIYSPFSILLLYSIFFSLDPLSQGFYSLLSQLVPYSSSSSLVTNKGNLIVIVVFFAYAPLYILSCMLLLCNYRITSSVTQEAAVKKTQ